MTYRPGLGWSVTGDPAPLPPAAPGPAEPSPGPAEEAARVACAAELRLGRLRALAAEAVDDPGGRPRRVAGARWRELSRLTAGAEVVFASPREEADVLLMELARRGLPGPARVRSLAAAVRGAVRLKRGSGPEAIASRLGIAWPEEPTPAEVAACIAACLRRADLLRETREDPGSSPALAGLVTDAFLARVPRAPGTYRFLDGKGRVLYAGKASDLRRRLRSYRSERRRAILDGVPEVDRIEFRVTGSDLQALLDEAAIIARRRPSLNVQREVRRRAGRPGAGRRRALILPAAGRGAATVIFLDGGACLGSVRIGPRGGGLAGAERILRGLLSGRPRRAGRPGPDPESPESRLVGSWLARHGEPTQLDLDSCRGPSDAVERLRRALEDVRRSAGGDVVHYR